MDYIFDNDAKVQSTKSRLEAYSAQNLNVCLESCYQPSNISYFSSTCRVNIQYAGLAAATKVKIQIRGFLQIGKVTALTALEKLLSSYVSVNVFKRGFFSRKVAALCLCEKEIRRGENSPWLPVQITGNFDSNIILLVY